MSRVFFAAKRRQCEAAHRGNMERVKYISYFSHGIAFPDHETPVLSCLSAGEAVSCTRCRKNLSLNLQARLRWFSLALAPFVLINSFARVDRQASDYLASLSPTAWQWASW